METKSHLPFLLIFDGLDELVMLGKSAKEVAKNFVDQLTGFCNRRNESSKNQVKVLLTGRPIAIQDAETKFREQDEQVLYLLPYYLNEEKQEDYSDPENLLVKDQRHAWWDKFYSLKGIAAQKALPEELRNSNMDKITAEPLLNYLVALTWQREREIFDSNTNLNDIYHSLITNVYQRDWEGGSKHKSAGDLSNDEFLQILEEIAICAWQGGDARVTTTKKIEAHIAERNLSNLLEEYKQANKGGVSRLLTAFYFRKYGKDEAGDETFEFTHKSFGEYLTARAFVELIEMLHDEYTNYKRKQNSRRPSTWNAETCLKEWLRVTGANVLDENLNNFIRNELSIRAKERVDIIAWQNTLVELLNYSMNHGMPLDSAVHTKHLEILRLTRNADEALVIAIANCARITKQLWKVEFLEIDPELYALNLFNRLATSFFHYDFCFRNLWYLDLMGANLMGANLIGINLIGANLMDADLAKANLDEVNLSGVNLSEVDLNGAHLSGAHLIRANLIGANLIGADLSGANLRGANLIGADLNRANLIGANLIGANLMDADLTEAYLTGAYLIETHLGGAYLSGAHLNKADLNKADLSRADLSRADLSGTDLTEADLTEADLMVAHLMEANLTEADLSKAHLGGADLSRADLSRADLSEVDLNEADLSEIKGLVFKQLVNTNSLYNTKGIPGNLEAQLKKEKPELFTPLWLP